jgi:RHS repeat-associated protein
MGTSVTLALARGNDSGLGWEIFATPAMLTYDTTMFKTGTKSLKISNPTSTEKTIHSDVWTKIDNTVATSYTYSAWVYSDAPQAELFLFMKTESETGYFTLVDSEFTNVTNQWVRMEGTFLVPANIKKLNLRLDNNGLGNVWFDDVMIRKTANTPLTNKLVPDVDYKDRKLAITYNTFKSPVEISEAGVDILSFTYNENNDRSVMFYGSLDATKTLRPLRKYYSADGSMEIKQNLVTGAIEFITYIAGDGYSAPVVYKQTHDATTPPSGVGGLLYLHRDYQGSILAITNDAGVILEKRQFDAWGSLINYYNVTDAPFGGWGAFDRGYTGHEHLQSVGLIHMNGRLYDPKLHRFLQPDNYVQDPSNTQNFNRYGYCWNNPLKFTDPSGEFIWFVPLIYAAVNLGVDMIQNKGNMNFGQIAMSLGQGALSGVLGGATSVGGAFLGAAVGQLNKFLPIMNIPITNNFSISASIGIGFGTSGFSSGINISGNYSNGDFSMSVGYGAGSDGTGDYTGYSGSVRIGDFGAGYSRTSYTGENSQVVGGASLSYKNVSFRLQNDFLGDQHDRWRSNAAELSIGDFVIGTNLYNNYPEGEGQGTENIPSRSGKYNKGDYKAWKSGKTYSSPAWIGYKQGNSVFRYGYSHPMVQEKTQNWTHRSGFLGLGLFGQQNYYLDDSEFKYGPYYYGGYNNPFTLW